MNPKTAVDTDHLTEMYRRCRRIKRHTMGFLVNVDGGSGAQRDSLRGVLQDAQYVVDTLGPILGLREES